jgi:hypothetical protein
MTVFLFALYCAGSQRPLFAEVAVQGTIVAALRAVASPVLTSVKLAGETAPCSLRRWRAASPRAGARTPQLLRRGGGGGGGQGAEFRTRRALL